MAPGTKFPVPPTGCPQVPFVTDGGTVVALSAIVTPAPGSLLRESSPLLSGQVEVDAITKQFKYPVVFFDALRVKIRDEATVRMKGV